MWLPIGICFVLCMFSEVAGTNDEISLSSLAKRMEELEKRDQLLMQIIEDQTSTINKLTTTVSRLEEENTQQNQKIANLQEELKSVKNGMGEPNNELTSKHTNSQRQTNPSGSRIIAQSPSIHNDQARRFLLDGAETVAFHATYSAGDLLHHAVGTPIAFTDVKLNVGGGFHPSTSLFIAPMPGIYIFSTSIMSSLGDSHGVHAGIMQNGTYLAGVFAFKDPAGPAEQGSVTVTTQLQTGEEVWVQHVIHNDGSIYGGGLTSFTGCLVTPL